MVKCHTPCRLTSTLRRRKEALNKLSPEERGGVREDAAGASRARGVTLPRKWRPNEELGQVLSDCIRSRGSSGYPRRWRCQAQRQRLRRADCRHAGVPQWRQSRAGGIAAMVVKRFTGPIPNGVALENSPSNRAHVSRRGPPYPRSASCIDHPDGGARLVRS